MEINDVEIWAQIDAMSQDELDGTLRSTGYNPAEIGRTGRVLATVCLENVKLRQRVADLETDNERIVTLYRQAVAELIQSPASDDDAVAVEVDDLRQRVAELEETLDGIPDLIEGLLNDALDADYTCICHDGASRRWFMRRLREKLASPASDGEE